MKRTGWVKLWRESLNSEIWKRPGDWRVMARKIFRKGLQ